jgi:hypothetical protein
MDDANVRGKIAKPAKALSIFDTMANVRETAGSPP